MEFNVQDVIATSGGGEISKGDTFSFTSGQMTKTVNNTHDGQEYGSDKNSLWNKMFQ